MMKNRLDADSIEVAEQYLKKQEGLRIQSEAAEEESHKRLGPILKEFYLKEINGHS